MGKIQSRAARGTRDILPVQMAGRRAAVQKIVNVFENYGYEPLETPAIERLEVLTGKYGEEGDKLIFKLQARGDGGKDADLALRYDLTVPLARVIASHPEIKLPFKRYQIQPVWRAERPQKGRFREFYQCDVDVVGAPSVAADAEMVAIVDDCLAALGFGDYRIRINHRKVLEGIALYSGTPPSKATDLCIAIDKLEKIGFEGVRQELERRGIDSKPCDKIMGLIEAGGSTGAGGSIEDRLGLLEKTVGATDEGAVGLADIREFLGYLEPLGVTASALSFDPCLARGLDYYTGLIYESVVEEPKIGSLTGGGRYDNLIGRFTGRDIPATGTTIGLERILAAMEDLGMLPEAKTCVQALVAFQDRSLEKEAFALAREIRSAGVRCEIYLKTKGSLRDQIAYANGKGVPWVVILGPDEMAEGKVVLKDMVGRGQRDVPLADAAKVLAASIEADQS
jgi:histidyl-tRNA synthetase